MVKRSLAVAMMTFAICSSISQISLAQGISIDQYKKKLMVTESRKIAKKNKVFDITVTFLSPRFRIADAHQDWQARRLTEDQLKIEEDKLTAKIKGEDRYLVSVTFKLFKEVSPKRLPVPDEFDKYVFLENDQGDFVKAELVEEPSISRIGAEDRAVFLFSFPKNKPDGTPLITDNTKYRKVIFTNLGDLGKDEARWELPVKSPYAPLEIAGIMEKTGLVEPRIRDSQMRLGIEIIRAAINSYAVDHRGKFPLSIDTATLGKYLLNEKIPENPYLKRPMRNTKNIGDFTYTVSKDRTSYSLKGNYHGDVVIKPRAEIEKAVSPVPEKITIPVIRYSDGDWDISGIGWNYAKETSNEIWGRKVGYISYTFRLNQAVGDYVLSARLSSELPNTTSFRKKDSSDVTLVINGKDIGTKNVIADDARGKIYSWRISASDLKKGENTISFGVKEEAKYKNGLVIYTKYPVRLEPA